MRSLITRRGNCQLTSTFRSLLLVVCGLVPVLNAFSQGASINPNGDPPNPSAILDVQADSINNPQGVLIPRMSTIQRDAIVTPAKSLTIYNTSTNCFEFYSNNAWQTLGCGCTPPGAAGTITGTSAVCQNQSGVGFSVSTIPGATGYVWTFTGTGFVIAAGANSNSISVNFLSTATSGVLTVYGVSNGCGNGDVSASYSITVNPAPSITAMSASTCSGSAFTVNPVNGVDGIVPGGTSYSWGIPTVSGGMTGGIAGSGSGISGTVVNTTSISQTATYAVTPSSGSCTGTPFDVVVTVRALPTASISGTTPVCLNASSPDITFSGANNSGPYTFTYTLNGGAPQTVTTTSGSSVTVSHPTNTAGTFNYELVSVLDGTGCSQSQPGTATITIPTCGVPGVCQTGGVCTNGVCSPVTPLASGTQNGGCNGCNYCNGSGSCVSCSWSYQYTTSGYGPAGASTTCTPSLNGTTLTRGNTMGSDCTNTMQTGNAGCCTGITLYGYKCVCQ